MSTAGGNSIPPEQLKARYLGTGHADISKQYVFYIFSLMLMMY